MTLSHQIGNCHTLFELCFPTPALPGSGYCSLNTSKEYVLSPWILKPVYDNQKSIIINHTSKIFQGTPV